MFKRSLVPIAFLVFFCFPAFAQEATAEPIPVVIVEEEPVAVGTLPDATQFEEDLSQDLTEKGLFVGFAAGFVFVLTALLKRLPFLSKVSSNQIKLVLNIIVWGAYVIASYYGQASQFEAGIGAATDALTSFTGFIITLSGASWLHQQSARNDVPILGHQRSVPPL